MFLEKPFHRVTLLGLLPCFRGQITSPQWVCSVECLLYSESKYSFCTVSPRKSGVNNVNFPSNLLPSHSLLPHNKSSLRYNYTKKLMFSGNFKFQIRILALPS